MMAAAQEAAGWAALDALQAAGESGDPMAKVKAACALLDWQMDAGLLTREELRMEMLPHLRDMMGVMTELDPKLADGQADIAIMKMDGRDGLDDAGWAALMLDAYQNARQDLGLDRVITPELRATLVRLSRTIEVRTDLACQLLHRHAHKPFSPAQGDHAEAWSTCKGALRDAQDILWLLDERVDAYEYGYLQRRAPAEVSE